jgi:hypothetical protein
MVLSVILKLFIDFDMPFPVVFGGIRTVFYFFLLRHVGMCREKNGGILENPNSEIQIPRPFL